MPLVPTLLYDMHMQPVTDQQLYDTLKELDVIKEDKLKEAWEESSQTDTPLTTTLLNNELISDEHLGQVIASIIQSPFIVLARVAIPDDILHIIPEVLARKQHIICFAQDEKGLHVASSEPSNIQLTEFLQKKQGVPIVMYYATEQDIINAFALYRQDAQKAFAEIIAGSIEKAQASSSKAAEPPIITIVDTIISYAYQNKASDIHIEPLDHDSLVRFRIDGVLHDIVKLPKKLHERVVTRIKVMASLRTDEHLAPQDGKIEWINPETTEKLSLRVSSVPITGGEKIVMRLLAERARQFSLQDLGFSKSDLDIVRRAYEKPYGMILATGPTGCGKTTTMYAILKLLNKRNVNIMTIEDPVEYDVEGVNQIQVNSKTNLTFANGLRSIVRQDPDIMLVGEIRDEETAGIAVNAAMTGHLVLSTLHTNDSTTTIPRFLDMGVEPFLIVSTINVIIAQRLVRKICQKCRVSKEYTETDLAYLTSKQRAKILGKQKSIRTYIGKGCPVCHNTGYDGRVGIFEVLTISEELRKAIMDREDADTLRQLATEAGMITMIDDGIQKVKEGVTTIDEIVRVTKT